MSLLDVGCGPGTITADLAARVAPGRVLAIDPSPDAVEQTRTLLAERSVPSTKTAAAETAATQTTVEVEVAEVETLPPDVGLFDVVHAHQVLQHVADPVTALRAMGRLCRPGGLVAARDGDYAGFTWYPRIPELDEWLALYRQATRANGGEPDAGRRLLAWAREAGLQDVTPSASVWCFADPAGRSWWGGMWADRIVQSAVARQLVDSGLATTADLERISAAWRRWAADDDGWFAVLNGEIRCRVPA
jgi:SAM-dependent methyltransferase